VQHTAISATVACQQAMITSFLEGVGRLL